MMHFKRILGYWIPLVVVASGLCLFTYIGIQQNYRMNANDPQIEMAETAADALSNGAAIEQVLPSATVKMESSLTPFMMVFDSEGNVLASSASLNGQTPMVPEGVLTASLEKGENRVTWQPQANVRIAAVIVPYSANGQSGYVLAGRSLKEVEARINNLTLMLTLTWLCALLTSFATIIFAEYVLLHPKNG